jgi:arginyl-tRNA synthetase
MMKEKILELIRDALGRDENAVELSVPDDPRFGHFSTNVAMRIAKERGAKPMELAEELAKKIHAAAPKGFFEKIEPVAPGFINFWLTNGAWRTEFARIIKNPGAAQKETKADGTMVGKTVMVEFTDPNPFKLFHIGHLMSNTIGESFARLYESQGAKVIRANYQGDIGLHVAKAMWGMERIEKVMPSEHDDVGLKMVFLGVAYARGAKAYDDENETEARGEIEVLNEEIYSKKNSKVNELYAKGRAWSLEYFETVYARLGTKFERYYFESEMAAPGGDVVSAGLEKGIFKKSDGAVVFPGEDYGLHTRVFVNSRGLPTYEAKELALNKKKFEEYPLDYSVIVTSNEIKDYFRVLLKVMELMLPPEVAARTRHVPHGLLRLPTGKMSSRTGDVITADALLEQVKERLREKVSERSSIPTDEREAATEAIAIGAVKYSILKQNPGQDIIFDFEKSLSFEGDAGPYLQYAYARLRSILRKAHDEFKAMPGGDVAEFGTAEEFALIRRIAEFPDVAAFAAERLAPSGVAAYAYKLAVAANKFYETTPILKDENVKRRDARLALADVAAKTLAIALSLLGMKVLEAI